jgi:hypothetical protein
MPDKEHITALRWLNSDDGRQQMLDLSKTLPVSAKQIVRLREQHGVARASAIVITAIVYDQAVKKLGHDFVLATDRGLQQATDHHIAKYKAGRFAEKSPIIDLCSGIGGDSIALSGRSALLAIDRDPAICVMVANNLAVANAKSAIVVEQAADQTLDCDGYQLHVDPDRRPEGKRISDPNFGEPPASVVRIWMEKAAGGAVKLSPAADIPEVWDSINEREWISRKGSCRQQVAWFGNLGDSARPMRSATMVDNIGNVHRFICAESELARKSSTPVVKVVQRPMGFMYDFDPAIRAAGLTEAFAASLQLACLESSSGFMTGPDSGSGDRLASGYEVLWFGSRSEKVLRRELAVRRPSSLEIKVRGVDVLPEHLRPRLLPSPGDGQSLTLLIGKKYAAIGRITSRNVDSK